MGGKLTRELNKDLTRIQQRVEAWVQPMAEHEVQAVDVDTRTSLNPRSAKAFIALIAIVVLGAGVWLALNTINGREDQDISAALAPGLEPLPATTSAAPTGTATETTTASAIVVVSVQGLVRQPGLYRLPAETRVGEAVEAAGGHLPEANLTAVNLAEKVSDGVQIVVTAEGSSTLVAGQGPESQQAPPSGATTGAGDSGGSVNVNSATATELEALPGVGPATAAAIVSWRDTHGPFTSVEQLMEVRGIGPAKFESLKDAIRVD